MNKYLLLLLTSFFFSCNSEIENAEDERKVNQSLEFNAKDSDTTSAEPIEQYTVKTTFSLDVGWGYQILNEGKAYINQPHIPAISGVKGFDSEEDAIKTAHLAIHKLKNGIIPPSITKDDLDSLGVLH